MDLLALAIATLVSALLVIRVPAVQGLACAVCNPCNATNTLFDECSASTVKGCFFLATRVRFSDNVTVSKGCEYDQNQETYVRVEGQMLWSAASRELQMTCTGNFTQLERSHSVLSDTARNVRILCHCGYDRCNQENGTMLPFPFDGSVLPSSSATGISLVYMAVVPAVIAVFRRFL